MSVSKPHPCCNEDANLNIEERLQIKGMTHDGREVKGERIMRRCKVCSARHFEISADPIPVSAKIGQ